MLAIVRELGGACAVALVFLALNGTLITPPAVAAGREGTVLAANSPTEGTIKLGAEPIHLRLGDASVDNLARRAGDERVYLVLDQVRAKQQPGILYQVILGAADGDQPIPDTNKVVGHLNFFELSHPFLSFDVTDHVQRLAGTRGRKLIVTIQPAIGDARAERAALRRELDEAEMTVDRVRLVAQRE
jgi:hypothetical protein